MKPTKKLLGYILDFVPNMSVYDSVVLLTHIDRYALDKKAVYVHGLPTTYLELVEELYDVQKSVNQMPKMYFTCGPPGEEKWAWGGVAQYVCDSLLVAAVQGKEERIIEFLHRLLFSGAP